MYRVGILEIEVHMPTAHSLKERRSLLKGPVERVRGRFNVSVIEASGNDGWQRATVTAACVGSREEQVRQELEKVGEHFERADGLVVLESRLELL
jgi:uncharacterized protein YlxP (DUF503 family)